MNAIIHWLKMKIYKYNYSDDPSINNIFSFKKIKFKDGDGNKMIQNFKTKTLLKGRKKMVGVDDLVLLDSPSNEKIVDMLKTRYAADQIYVFYYFKK